MFYWFTHGKYTFPAKDREAWTLYSKKKKSTYHGATDGEIYREALNDNKLQKFQVDESIHNKPQGVVEQEEKLQVALNEAIKQEVARADKNVIPKNMDTIISTKFNSPTQDQLNAVKSMLGR